MVDIRRIIKQLRETPLYQGLVGLPSEALAKGGIVVVIVLAILAAAILPKFIYRVQEVALVEEQKQAQEMYQHPLTGVWIYDQIEPPQVFGVMIDNHEEAWPAAGVEEAFLVIEAPVEAGIPRMLAFFSQEQEVETIGPVRSARPYYLDWAAELDALYAHVGGSNAALDDIASGGTFDMNQYWWGQYFWRSTQRYSPHNVFTSTELLNDFYELREEASLAPTRLYDVWTFKDPEPTDTESHLYIDFWAPVYVVDWDYNSETGMYERSQFNEPHVAYSGERIAADNVAVVVTEVKIIDYVGRRDIRTTGEGYGYVLQDGQVIEVTWKKPSISERLKFYDRETGEEIVMNAGRTWIEVVPTEDDIRID
jgi:hypothetical protein